jgi:hypothetical protein
MDAQLKAKWVEALRSGDYTQQRHEIGIEKHLCCIGVCGVVAGIPQGGDWDSYYVAGRIGLTPDDRDILFEMNDAKGKSFAEIADYIEANL